MEAVCKGGGREKRSKKIENKTSKAKVTKVNSQQKMKFE